MQLTCSIGFLTFVAAMVLAASCRAATQEDPFIELETNAQGVHTYVRRDEIEALTDVSPAHCVLFLTSGTSFPQSKNVRACQTCAVSFQADFGNTYISPQGIDTMAWTSNSRCRISLKSGKFVYAKESCNEVHKAMPRE
jgi:hypothetical protein